MNKKSLKKTLSRLRLGRWDSVTILYGLAAAVFFIGLVVLGWFFFFNTKSAVVPDADESAVQEPTAPCEERSAFSGVCLDDEQSMHPRLVGVMIENHVDARPSAGLARAQVVYEAPVEANITRFLALYEAGADVDKVGPVRSARPYYLDWMSEYDGAMYMHVGGSPEALEQIPRYDIFDVNEFSRGWYFWRSGNRRAPHNTYTSQELWQKAWNEHGASFASTTYDGWRFDTVVPFSVASTTVVAVSFAPPWYAAEWRFNSSTGQYERYQYAGTKGGWILHRDEDGARIVADTVVVQRMKSVAIDAVGRRRLDTAGSGEALVFRDGVIIEGTWKKASRTARTRFFDASGTEIPLKPGIIWIEVVGLDGEVAYE